MSAGCVNCYAETMARRFAQPGQPYHGLVNGHGRWNGTVRLVPEHLADPLRWKRPRRVFVNSMSDLFHESLTNEQIAAVFGVMGAAPQHTFQVLTKRARRMREWFEWVAEPSALEKCHANWHRAALRCARAAFDHLEWHQGLAPEGIKAWPLPNVWLGVSVENQDAADERIPELLQTPAAVRFLSCEPLIGPVLLGPMGLHYAYRCATCGENAKPDHDGTCYHCGDDCTLSRDRIDWIIAGCESGPGARACSVEWLRSLRDQCRDARVPFFLKQAIEDNRPGRFGSEGPVAVAFAHGSKRKSGGVIELPYLDGVQHVAFPEVTHV